MYVSANDEEVERVKVEYNLVNEGSIVDVQLVRHIQHLGQVVTKQIVSETSGKTLDKKGIERGKERKKFFLPISPLSHKSKVK